MKKTLWMLGVAVAALTSCTQSEVVDVPESKMIGFETFVNKQTRATNDIGDLSADFKELYVFGDKGVLNANGSFVSDAGNGAPYLDHVKLTGGKGNWTYQEHKSWVENKVFRFAAYANGLGDGIGTVAQITPWTQEGDEELNTVKFIKNEDVYDKDDTDQVIGSVWGLDIYNYTVSDKDLIVAVPDQKPITDINAAPTSVGLTFKHVLAKVIFEFRYVANSNNNDLNLEIEPFNVSAKKTGDCKLRFTGVDDNTIIGANWTPKTQGTYEFFPQTSGGVNQSWSNGNMSSAMYVIPQSNVNLKVSSINITTTRGEDVNKEVTAENIFNNVSLAIPEHENWLPGYVYRYVADITPGEHYIHFTTSVTSWIDEDDRNYPVQSGPVQNN